MLGQSQNILVCQASSTADTTGICPSGQSLATVQGYILTNDGFNLFSNFSTDLDYGQLGEAFAFGFTTILMFYCVAKGIGLLFRAIR